ncbi:FAD-binding oxidoreductase [Thalassospira sp. NFXS8]|uniref:NAD(P)/FAD-dependent oxidoreductase n=1 Tax=Thalassospira sp. NFXS8 TaxID=2819093 RepID=UPI0032DF78E2
MDADIIVIGAGVVGAALAFGLARDGYKVKVLDGKNRDLRAARANFGLVWVQGKGVDAPAYSQLTHQSAELWPRFCDELANTAQVQIDYTNPGGLHYCLGDAEFEHRAAIAARINNAATSPEIDMLSRRDLEKMVPAAQFGPDVTGASYCRLDGHVNPLQLLDALHNGIAAHGGSVVFRHPVTDVKPLSTGFAVHGPAGTLQARYVIIAAGLGTAELANRCDMNIKIGTTRGQILVTERLDPLLPFPASGLRQTAEGTVMIGATQEQTSDRGVSVNSAITLARRATRIIPALASVRLVRQWSGFRILPPDGSPIYAQSKSSPGLFAAVCHSGVTLAAAHAAIVGPAMINGQLDSELSEFSDGRFHV